MNKFENAPSIRLISLYESEDRRQIMREQFEKYGITNYHFFLSERYEKIKSNFRVDYHFSPSKGNLPWNAESMHGSVITHLENMRQWYITTNEPYAIFMDDDLDFSTSEYWNFTLKEFIDHLPPEWEAVQLIRCQQPPGQFGPDAEDTQLKLFWGRWWGAAFLMKRSYVRKVIERHIRGSLYYNLRILDNYDIYNPLDFIENVENTLMLGKTRPLNFPLFTNLPSEKVKSTYYGTTDLPADYLTDESDRVWETTRQAFYNLWKSKGHEVNLKTDLIP